MSAAAARLGMTPSAVSQTIKGLERQYGVTLLHRSTRKLTLTEDGQRCYEHCLRLKEAYTAATDSLSEARDAPTGELRIAAPIGFGSYVAPALAPILTDWPELRLRLLVSDEMVDLIDARVDLAIRVGKLTNSDWVARKLCELEMILCASPAYLERHDTPTRPEDLTAHHWIASEKKLVGSQDGDQASEDASSSTTLTLQGKNGKVENVTVDVRIATTTQATLQQICEQGLGIARVPHIDAYLQIERNQLVQVLPTWKLPALPVTLVSPRRESEPAKVRAAIRALRAYFTQLPTETVRL
ncbi:transcriptional regulator (plasmid) [Burkholderia sp. THE68]|nr:transcriptional regulator [Burkholderia sp. THE68]